MFLVAHSLLGEEHQRCID
jgi:hypothetical protein